MGIIGRYFLGIGAVGLLVLGLGACGGGDDETAGTPTAIFGGAATAGDIFVLKMDYPGTGKATVTRSETDGSLIGEKELTYAAAGNTYTFTDGEDNEFTGFMVPDTMLAMEVPDTTESDIVIMVVVDTTVTSAADLSFLKDEEYLLTQFRHDETGVRWVWSTVDADGAIDSYRVDNIDDVPTETPDSVTGMDVDDLTYRPETSGFVLTVDDETWTFYYTKSGLGVIDKGPEKGIRFNSLKGTTTAPPAGMTEGDVYNTIFYGSQSETESGTSIGTITVMEKGEDYFVVTIDPGKGAADIQTGVRWDALADPWLGFFRVAGENAVVQPVGSDAIVFSGKAEDDPPWQYRYGIGVK